MNSERMLVYQKNTFSRVSQFHFTEVLLHYVIYSSIENNIKLGHRKSNFTPVVTENKHLYSKSMHSLVKHAIRILSLLTEYTEYITLSQAKT